MSADGSNSWSSDVAEPPVKNILKSLVKQIKCYLININLRYMYLKLDTGQTKVSGKSYAHRVLFVF